MKKRKEAIRAIKYSSLALVLGTSMTLGIVGMSNYKENHNRVRIEDERVILKKSYGIFSHLEFVRKGEYIEEISLKSSRGLVKKIKFNKHRGIEKITENRFSLFGELNVKEYTPENLEEDEKKSLEKEIKEYFKYLNKK